MADRKKIIIISGYVPGSAVYRGDEYVDAFAGSLTTYDFVAISTYDVFVDISAENFSIKDAQGIELSEYDAILVRGKTKVGDELLFVISRYAAVHGVPIANDHTTLLDSSKLSQAALFYEHALPCIRTLFSYDTSRLVSQMEHTFGYPAIVKANNSAHGYDNHLMRANTDTSILHPDIAYVAQPFIRNDGDYRVLVQGLTPPLQIHRRATEGTHLNNTSQGAAPSLRNDLSELVLSDVLCAAQAVGLTIAGVDVMFDIDTGKHYILEVNVHPQLITGACTGDKIRQLGAYLDIVTTS